MPEAINPKGERVTFNMDETKWPTVCEHCGSTNLIHIGLVAPKCEDCGHFTLTHMTIEKVEKL